jgi:hypothetical protein
MLPSMRGINISLIDHCIDMVKDTIKRNRVLILWKSIREVTIQNIRGDCP